MQKCAEMMGSVDRDFSQHRSCENRTRSTTSAKYYRMSIWKSDLTSITERKERSVCNKLCNEIHGCGVESASTINVSL
jgi:hypothetical protein